MNGAAMNDYEELLAKAWACLSEASKIQDTELRAKVLDLVYHAQQVAEAALVRDINGASQEAQADGSFVPSSPQPKR